MIGDEQLRSVHTNAAGFSSSGYSHIATRQRTFAFVPPFDALIARWELQRGAEQFERSGVVLVADDRQVRGLSGQFRIGQQRSSGVYSRAISGVTGNFIASCEIFWIASSPVY